MRGKILSGLGQAQYFLTREGYSRQFLECLGFIPFPGTLNVLLESPFPAQRQAIEIEGFVEGSKSFGECKCYRIKVNLRRRTHAASCGASEAPPHENGTRLI